MEKARKFSKNHRVKFKEDTIQSRTLHNIFVQTRKEHFNYCTKRKHETIVAPREAYEMIL
jgi:hypothetical protein